jgi:hypothetical protein
MGTEMWTSDVAKQLRGTARGLFRHEHGTEEFRDAEEEDLVRTNCGACRLTGYLPVPDGDEPDVPPEPNYAGWERAYVEAGRPIPAVFREAFEDARVDKNRAYAAGLARDIATFGVTFTD